MFELIRGTFSVWKIRGKTVLIDIVVEYGAIVHDLLRDIVAGDGTNVHGLLRDIAAVDEAIVYDLLRDIAAEDGGMSDSSRI